MATSVLGIAAVYNILPEWMDECKHELNYKAMMGVTEKNKKMNVHCEKITDFIT